MVRDNRSSGRVGRPTHTLVQRRLLGNAVVVSRKRNSQAEPIHRPLRSTTIWKLRDRVSRRPVRFSSSRLMTRLFELAGEERLGLVERCAFGDLIFRGPFRKREVIETPPIPAWPFSSLTGRLADTLIYHFTKRAMRGTGSTPSASLPLTKSGPHSGTVCFDGRRYRLQGRPRQLSFNYLQGPSIAAGPHLHQVPVELRRGKQAVFLGAGGRPRVNRAMPGLNLQLVSHLAVRGQG